MIMIWSKIVGGEYESGEYRIVHDESGWGLFVGGKLRGDYATLREAKREANVMAKFEVNKPPEYVGCGDEVILERRDWKSFSMDGTRCYTRVPCLIIAEEGTGHHYLIDKYLKLDLGRFGTLQDATEAAHCYKMGKLTGDCS